jgi:hypothetical protein
MKCLAIFRAILRTVLLRGVDIIAIAPQGSVQQQ